MLDLNEIEASAGQHGCADVISLVELIREQSQEIAQLQQALQKATAWGKSQQERAAKYASQEFPGHDMGR